MKRNRWGRRKKNRETGTRTRAREGGEWAEERKKSDREKV